MVRRGRGRSLSDLQGQSRRREFGFIGEKYLGLRSRTTTSRRIHDGPRQVSTLFHDDIIRRPCSLGAKARLRPDAQQSECDVPFALGGSGEFPDVFALEGRRCDNDPAGRDEGQLDQSGRRRRASGADVERALFDPGLERRLSRRLASASPASPEWARRVAAGAGGRGRRSLHARDRRRSSGDHHQFEVDGYQTSNMAIFSPHLFEGFDIVSWAYADEPLSLCGRSAWTASSCASHGNASKRFGAGRCARRTGSISASP